MLQSRIPNATLTCVIARPDSQVSLTIKSLIRKGRPTSLSTYKFKPSERYAVFTVHREVCYLCKQPIDMATFQVDHVIPEYLSEHPAYLQSVITSYGLSEDFDLNSFENWLPACARCNNEKRGATFEALPIFAVQLKKASGNADKARALEVEIKSKQTVSRAITIIETAHQQGTLGELHFSRLRPLVEFHQEHREPELASTPIMLAPLFEVLSQDGELLTVKGPYGIGVGRANPPSHGNFRCPSCGHSAWNGARCVVCGTQDDD